MNKITKKLFANFFAVSVVFSSVVLVAFCGILRHYMIEHRIEEIKETAFAVKKQLEWMSKEGTVEGRGAYVKYLNDVTLAEVYVVTSDGSPFTCGKNPDSEKKATKEVEEFSKEIFEQRQYYQITLDENNVVYAGIPIEEEEEITAVVVFVDRVPIDEKTFFLSVSVLFGCLFVAMGISGVLSLFLAKRFIKPIHKIADATKELASGNYLVKTEVKDKDEIGILAKEVDILAEKLDFANRESERMNQMQKDYIANISHELRTPVAVLRSSVEALCDGVVSEEQIEEYEKQMLAETISLQRLVNDMLEISRLENKDFPIEKEEVDLLMILEDALRASRMIAIEKNIEVCCEVVEDEWLIEGDYGRLKQMFLAVLDNAVKYSDENTKITIQTMAKSEDYYISIQDEGCGIPEEKQEYIFDKFYRTENSTKTGSGLGMVIVKKIAERHQIEIRLHSEEGKGTKVTFIVPVNNAEKDNR